MLLHRLRQIPTSVRELRTKLINKGGLFARHNAANCVGTTPSTSRWSTASAGKQKGDGDNMRQGDALKYPKRLAQFFGSV